MCDVCLVKKGIVGSVPLQRAELGKITFLCIKLSLIPQEYYSFLPLFFSTFLFSTYKKFKYMTIEEVIFYHPSSQLECESLEGKDHTFHLCMPEPVCHCQGSIMLVCQAMCTINQCWNEGNKERGTQHRLRRRIFVHPCEFHKKTIF